MAEQTQRRSFITGGAGGIGEAVAHGMAEDGFHVIITDLDLAACQAVADAITAKGGSAEALALDVTDRAAVEATFAAQDRLGLSGQVLVGLVLGIASGVFFGEAAAKVQIVGDAFIRLLQMTVVPYVLVSLVRGLGGLDADMARRIGLRGGGMILILWAVASVLIPVFWPLVPAG